MNTIKIPVASKFLTASSSDIVDANGNLVCSCPARNADAIVDAINGVEDMANAIHLMQSIVEKTKDALESAVGEMENLSP